MSEETEQECEAQIKEGGLPDEFDRRLHFVDVSGGGC